MVWFLDKKAACRFPDLSNISFVNQINLNRALAEGQNDLRNLVQADGIVSAELFTALSEHLSNRVRERQK